MTAPAPIAVVLAQYPDDERDRRQAAIRAAAPHGQPVEFVEIEGSVFKKGLTHDDRASVAPGMARAARAAQDRGCSAVVPYGTLDLGIEEARRVVDIPVMGPGRTISHIAATVAQRIAVLCYDEPHVVMFSTLVQDWGVADHIVSIRSVGVPITEMAADPERLRERFLATARDALERDEAELILPLGMTMVPVLMSADSLATELGAPVLDPLAMTLFVASGLAAGRFTNSRIAYPSVDLT